MLFQAPGDIWYFPPGFPHSIQATNTTSDGSEILLIFDSGNFSEDDTFLLTDWLAHVRTFSLLLYLHSNKS